MEIYDGYLYIGTSCGLDVYDIEKQAFIHHWTIDNGLASNYVYSVVSTDDYVYVGTNSGLSRFDKQKGWFIDQSLEERDVAYPSDPSVDIGNDGDVEWSEFGKFDHSEQLPDLTEVLNNLLEKTEISYTDVHGNDFCDIPIKISSDLRGIVGLSDLNIFYTYTARTGDLSKEINDFLALHETNGTSPINISVPIECRSITPGRIFISDLIVDYYINITQDPFDDNISREEDLENNITINETVNITNNAEENTTTDILNNTPLEDITNESTPEPTVEDNKSKEDIDEGDEVPRDWDVDEGDPLNITDPERIPLSNFDLLILFISVVFFLLIIQIVVFIKHKKRD